VDGSWISDLRTLNLVDRSPCAEVARRAIIWAARRGRGIRIADRRKAVGLIAR
jgi:hypothetical protein